MAKNTYEQEVISWSIAFAEQFQMQIQDQLIRQDGYFQVELSFLSGVEISSQNVWAFDQWLIANQPNSAVILGTHYKSEPRLTVILFGQRH
jgi:hypothetical protein